MDYKDKIMFFDGAMGTMLQSRGVKIEQSPETLNITNPDIIKSIHAEYKAAGCDIITANTFGANRYKFKSDKYSLEEVISSGVHIAKEVSDGGLVALDVGPLGKLLYPMSDLTFEDAYNAFYEMISIGFRSGADIILIETMTDTLEAKAAILAGKEACNLPIFATMTFDENGRTLTGADPLTMISLFEALRVDVLGINCGIGSEKAKSIFYDIQKYTSIPCLVQPNAGLPKIIDGTVKYDMSPEKFAQDIFEIASSGAKFLGGCCGTTPDHLKAAIEKCSNITVTPITKKDLTVASSYSRSLVFDDTPIIIGERINPNGKPYLEKAIKDEDFDTLIDEAIDQMSLGAQIIDINVCVKDTDEATSLTNAVSAIQASCPLPLQIDSSNPEAIEKAIRPYNGKPIIDSVNGSKESMEKIFAIAKKYGGVIIALTLDENGIPSSAQGRKEIAEKILKTAKDYGIESKDIIIDPLATSLILDDQACVTAIEAAKLIKKELNVKTVLGISNASFGLPNRKLINAAFYDIATKEGVDCVIIDPDILDIEYDLEAKNLVLGQDADCLSYIETHK